MASALSYSKPIVKTFNTQACASERKILIEKIVMTNVNDLSISITKSKYSQRSGRCSNSEDEKVKTFARVNRQQKKKWEEIKFT